MRINRRIVLWILPAGLSIIAIAATLFFYARHRRPLILAGAVTILDADPRKELPIANVEIMEAGGLADAPAQSDANGFFRLRLRPGVRRGSALTLQFRHPDYRLLDLKVYAGDQLYIAGMVAISKQPPNIEGRRPIHVGNVRIRYSIKTPQQLDIGSAVKTFEIENKGNVPCKGQSPCSPDGKWKAATGSASLDAGAGNEFRNARVSCIAGPCPFTKIDSDGFSEGGQTIKVSARGWSDTTTFLVEAEVFRPMLNEVVHESYPVIFGRALNFTLPSAAEGVSMEGDIDGETIIFPLGPALILSWADCNASVNRDQTKVYRCELKSGYQFQ